MIAEDIFQRLYQKSYSHYKYYNSILVRQSAMEIKKKYLYNYNNNNSYPERYGTIHIRRGDRTQYHSCTEPFHIINKLLLFSMEKCFGHVCPCNR
jgi:hypothetical protein